ncbi:toxin-antitoxin system TumE family protein [Desulfonatronum thiodismutans]|uniref:toxin-antitoxin system TumE family protein n=1 Tax=Desulfonatronum thiodismutans TaxID=159290 RepID=UPI000A012620|nr:DUF6516 family protein [Desulfonatronum thiodismutans]
MAIFKLLDSLQFIFSYTVLDFKTWPTGSYLKMRIVFNDQSVLHVREYSDERERNYSYHWQDEHGTLIARWDNAPHHSHLTSFPHHRHKDNHVEESFEISLEDVLKRIEINM